MHFVRVVPVPIETSLHWRGLLAIRMYKRTNKGCTVQLTHLIGPVDLTQLVHLCLVERKVLRRSMVHSMLLVHHMLLICRVNHLVHVDAETIRNMVRNRWVPTEW